MRWVKRVAVAFGGLILVVLLAAVAGAAWLNSDGGKAWLQAAANRLLAGEARVAGIGGSLPFHVAVGRIDLLDDRGVWTRLDDVRLDIAPWDLLRRRLTIERLAAAMVDVRRSPVRAQPAAEPAFRLPLPVDVELRQLALGSVHLPSEVFGEPTAWTAEAAASLVGANVALALNVRELDPSPVRLEARFELSDRRANARATLDDPRGLLLRAATGESLPLHVLLADDPGAAQQPADWHGRLTARVGTEARLQASLHLAATHDTRVIDTDGDFDGASLLSAGLAPLLQPTLKFHLAARDVVGAGWSVDGLMLHSDAFNAEGTGTYRARGGVVDASLRLLLPDLGRFSALTGNATSGSADMVIAAKGPLDALRAELGAHAARVAFGTATVDDAAARLALSRSAAGYRVDGEGTLAGVRSGGAPLAANLGKAVSWTIAGNADAALDKLNLAGITLSSGGMKLAGEGAFDARSASVTGTAQLNVDDLRDFAELAPGWRGRGQLEAAIAGSLSGGVDVRLNGGLDDFATGIPAADALIGGRARLDADVRRDATGRLRLDDAALRAGAMRLTANGTVDPAERINADFTVSADDLAVLRRAGLPVAGRLEIQGKVAGPVSAPALDAHVHGSALAWQSARIDDAAFALHATTAGAPAASLGGELRSQGIAVRVEADTGLSSDRKTLTLSRLRVASGTNVIAARLRTALDSLLTGGTVTAELPDLRQLSPLAGMELGGRMNLKLDLSPRQNQSADLELVADGLSALPAGTTPVHLDHVAANGRLAGLLRQATGRVELTGDGLSAAGGAIRRLRASGRASRPGRYAFEGDMDGDFKGPFALAAGGTVVQAGGATRATLDRLNGRVAGTPVRLQRPLRVTAQGPVVAVTDLALAIGDGTIAGRARRDAASLELNLDARRLPAQLAGHFAGRDDLSGTIDARVEIAGPAAQPRGSVTVHGSDLRAGPAAAGAAPPLGLDARASLAPRRVDVDATIEASGARLLSVTGSVPMIFGSQPGGASLAEDRPLDLKLRGAGDLTRLADFLPLAGDRVAGQIRLALDVAGTPARPEVSGDLSLDHGHFEDLESGLVVDALAVDIGAERDRLVLRRFSGTDGDKGKLAGSGTLAFGPTSSSGAAPSTLTVSLTKFQALRRPDAMLTASGSATVAGTWKAPVLVARLMVDRAEFFIPDPPPPAARKIPVTVIDSATGKVLHRPQEETESGSAMGAIRLDVEVRVPGNTFIRGRGLDSEWQGDVQARGSSAAPELTGSLRVVKGAFSFFGKDMNLTRGTVTFTGGHEIVPQIDVLAETTTSEATFDVGVTGTPDDLKIKLSSTPAMPQDEILARLIFGRDVTRLSPAEGLQLAQAAATLSSGGPGMLDKVRQKLGLDVLNIGSMKSNTGFPTRPQSGATSGQGGALGNTGISAGKYIANGVYVGAAQGLSGETRSRVEVEVLPHVRVESEAGTRSEEIGVTWRMDY